MVDVQELNRQIRMALETGDVILGANKTIRALKMGEPKLVIISMDCPEDIREDVEYYAELAEIPVFVYPGTSIELGDACGRPHVVATMAVLDDGESNLLNIVEQAREEGVEVQG